MRHLKDSIQQHAFNEDHLLKSIKAQASLDGLSSQWAKQPKENTMKKKYLGWILGMMVIAVGIWTLNPKVEAPIITQTLAIVTVDINPSFALSVDESHLVVSIVAQNEDALTIDTSSILGLPVGQAINDLVQLTSDAGFIDLLDLEDDFVVVTQVMEDGTSVEMMDQIHLNLEQHLQTDTALQSVQVIQLKASQVEFFEAQEKDVPVGLYVLNGNVAQADGSYLSAKEFFSKAGNLEALQSQAAVHTQSETLLRTRIEMALTELEAQGMLTTELRTRLEVANLSELQALQTELMTTYQAQLNSNQSENAQGTPSENKPIETPSPSENKPEDSGSPQRSSGGSTETTTPQANQSEQAGQGNKN